ncbi:MAG: sodium/proline symporter [Fidelibacterota bacterium]
MNTIALAFVLYLLIILGVGFYTVRILKDIKDYALGGQRLGPWVIALSERASGESAWLILGLPGAALVAGLLELWTVVGCVSGIIFSWLIIAKPLRDITEKYNALTLPELLERRFNDKKGTIRILSAVIIIFFFTFYVAAQFSGAGKVLNVTFGLSEMQGMIIGAFIIIIYTMMGGFLAVAWTDVIQGVIMFGTLVILPIVAFFEMKTLGASGVIWDTQTLYGGKIGWGAIAAAIGGLSWGLGYLGQPHLVVRYMAIDSSTHIGLSRKIAFAWAIPAFFGSMFIGLIGLHIVNAGVLSFEGKMIQSVSMLPDPEKLMPILATYLLPAWLAGIFISGAIAAMMSTADSQLLVSTTILTEDLVSKTLKKPNTDYLKLSRILTVLIGILAFIMAWRTEDLVFEMVSYAWSGLGASFGPALVLMLWWKRTTRKGIIAGLITGAITTIIWVNIDSLQVLMTERLTSFVFAFIAVIVVSLMDREQ